MNDLPTDASNGEYFTALITFWVVLVVGVLFIYRYVWPIVEHLYWSAAKRLYWMLRKFCENSRHGAPTLYSSINIYKKEQS